MYDTGTFYPILSYHTHWKTGAYLAPGRSYLWGPDLSGTLTGAGGIGGLAITYDDLNDQHAVLRCLHVGNELNG